MPTCAVLESSTTAVATHSPSQDLSRRELSCIASYTTKESTWKQVALALTRKPVSLDKSGVEKKTHSELRFDSVKSFAISSDFDFEGKSVMVSGRASGNTRKKIIQQLLRSSYTSLATNLEIGMIDARVPSNFLGNF